MVEKAIENRWSKRHCSRKERSRILATRVRGKPEETVAES